MSEFVPPGVAGGPACPGPQALSDALADFARWYAEAVDNAGPPPPAPPAVDLATLLGHFVALRQEIHLQTRSVRAQQEQTAELARQVQQGIEALARSPRAAGGDDPCRPLLKALLDAYDALALAGGQIQKARAALAAPPHCEPPAGLWARWFARRPPPPPEPAAGVADALDALVTGYTMSLERIDRAIRQHGLEPIAAVGRPFDPELMEALEMVAGTGRPAGEVVEEVRRGYLQNGRAYRFALVRVARD